MGIILTFDCGTQSTRAMLFNDKGELIDKIKETFPPYYSTQEGYAEQDPELYWQKACAASQKLKERNADIWDTIIGVAVSAMRDVGICIDKDRKPLRPCILWLDRRLAACKNKMPLTSRVAFALAGMTKSVEKNRKEAKCNWIQENEPDIWAKTYKYIQYSTFLNMRLTGEIKDSIASMIVHMPFDYKNKCWMKKSNILRPAFTMEDDKLFDLVPPGDTIGYITKNASEETGIPEGVPLIAAGSDKGCETVGTGAIFPHTASISFGTTATIQITTDKHVEPDSFMPAYPSVCPDKYNPESMVFRGYWMLTWFIQEFVRKSGEKGKEHFERELDRLVGTIPPGCEGLYVEPYWSPSLKRPEARGSIIGFNERHGLVHVYRAIIEGINFALMEGKNKLEKNSKVKITELMVSGGGAQSDEVCQLTADMFNLPVSRAQTYETSGLGAAICAFVGLKRFDSYEEAIKNMVRKSKMFLPNKSHNEIYAKIYKDVYIGSYKRLKPIFEGLNKQKNY